MIIPPDRQVQYYEDIGFLAILDDPMKDEHTGEEYDHVAGFKVYQVYKSGGSLVVDKANSQCTPNPTEKLEEAEVFLSGSVKWDGCSNFNLGEGGYYHFCSKQEAIDIGVLLGRLYDWAAKLIPNWDGD